MRKWKIQIWRVDSNYGTVRCRKEYAYERFSRLQVSEIILIENLNTMSATNDKSVSGMNIFNRLSISLERRI